MVEHIKIDGKSYPLRLSYSALKRTKNELIESNPDKAADLSIDKLMSEDLEIMEPLLYYGLLSGAKAEKEKLELERNDMEDALDDCWMQFLALLPRFFVAEEPQKKVVPKTTANKKK